MKKLCIFALLLGLFLAAATYSSKAEQPPGHNFFFKSFDEFLEEWPYISTLSKDDIYSIGFQDPDDFYKAWPYFSSILYPDESQSQTSATQAPTVGHTDLQGTDISSEPTNPSTTSTETTNATGTETTNPTGTETTNSTNIYLWVGILCATVLVIVGVVLGTKKNAKANRHL